MYSTDTKMLSMSQSYAFCENHAVKGTGGLNICDPHTVNVNKLTH